MIIVSATVDVTGQSDIAIDDVVFRWRKNIFLQNKHQSLARAQFSKMIFVVNPHCLAFALALALPLAALTAV